MLSILTTTWVSKQTNKQTNNQIFPGVRIVGEQREKTRETRRAFCTRCSSRVASLPHYPNAWNWLLLISWFIPLYPYNKSCSPEIMGKLMIFYSLLQVYRVMRILTTPNTSPQEQARTSIWTGWRFTSLDTVWVWNIPTCGNPSCTHGTKGITRI